MESVELQAQPFTGVRPICLEKVNIEDVITKLSPHAPYQVEVKLDGERFQIHMQNGVFKYYSHNLCDFTATFGKDYSSGVFTPFLKTCFNPQTTSFILDGEMMVWNKLKNDFGWRTAFDVKKKSKSNQYNACFCVFDVLYYNGKSLIGTSEQGGLPLAERMTILDTIFTDVPGVIQCSKRHIVTDCADILNFIKKAIDDQEEGIVVKSLDSYYIADERKAGWFKIKPNVSVTSDLDVVIIGAEFKSKPFVPDRAKNFHVACIDVGEDKTVRWMTIGRVVKGLSVEENEAICRKLKSVWSAARGNTGRAPPEHLVFNRDKPTHWVSPENSVVLQVQCTHLSRDSDACAGYELGAPRVERVRDDKPHTSVLTLTDFKHITAYKP